MGTFVLVVRLPRCNFCKGLKEFARYDGRTIYGSWANMCPRHFDMYGVGLGTGRGQELRVIGTAVNPCD